MATAGPSQPVPGGRRPKNFQEYESITLFHKSGAARDARDTEPSRRGIGCAIMHFECTTAGIVLGRDLYIQDNQLLLLSGIRRRSMPCLPCRGSKNRDPASCGVPVLEPDKNGAGDGNRTRINARHHWFSGYLSDAYLTDSVL